MRTLRRRRWRTSLYANKTGALASLNVETEMNPKEDESSRAKVKSEIDSILNQIEKAELESLKALSAAADNKGLHDAEEATKLFDEALKLDEEIIDPYKYEIELSNKRELLDDKLFDIKLLKEEVRMLDGTLDSLYDAKIEHDQELEEMRNQRQKRIQTNLKLEKLIIEYQEKLEREGK